MGNEHLSGKMIRQQFIDFFVGKGHTEVRSASLVPAGDQTILFTNAGMVQFKDVFLGTDVRPYTRACDTQKCMRVAGKHNDLDEVGRDDSHHTFFEMLGNWSFGDYYKKEAIKWAWELLTEVWNLDKSRLWATCFKDDRNEIPTDEEAYSIWKQQPGINPDHILYFGRKENFWEMAETGPCGPCSEIHVDLGPDRCNKQHVPGHVCHVNGDCSRFLEIWNLVFIQYNRQDENTLVPLKKHYVDTGMGFERIVSMLQKTDSNYTTDLFMPMIEKIRSLAGTSVEEMKKDFTPYRVIADHSRAASFLIADGVIPGNIGRNYVCRMIIRRAVRFGQQIGLRDGFMDKIAEVVIENYGEAFPELKRMQNSILRSIQMEEARFNKTLEHGIEVLNQVIRSMKEKGETVVDGEVSFDLYSTHGLPLEITYDIVREHGFDVDRDGFKASNERHRIASGAGKAIGSMGGEESEQFSQLLQELKTGGTLDEDGVHNDPYLHDAVQTHVVLILKDGEMVTELKEGESGEVVTDHSNFYIEMGGQIGDIGRITSDDGTTCFEIETVRRPIAGMILHKGKLVSGEIQIGQKITIDVDRDRRNDIMRNHTATHLLHAALRQVLGEDARQAGSLVSFDRLRFDFNSSRALTAEELSTIEKIVNDQILAAHAVTTDIESLDQAMEEGVTAIFDEKYGEIVRVVRVKDGDGNFSAELCGGTHVSNTSEIGSFFILSESSIATGVRRIEAITGHAASEYARRAVQNMKQVISILNARDSGVIQKVEELLSQLHLSEQEIQQLKRRIALSEFNKTLQSTVNINDLNVLVGMMPDSSPDILRAMTDKFKESFENAVVVLGTIENEQVVFIAAVSDSVVKRGINAGNIIKRVSEIVGGKGGGRPNMAQGGGKDVEKAQTAIDSIIPYLESIS